MITNTQAHSRLTAAIPSPEECRTPAFRREWEALVAASDNLYLQYQSPEWYDHLQATSPNVVLPPVAVRDEAGRLIGVIPLMVDRYELVFGIRNRIFWRAGLRTITVLGSRPLLPPDPGLHDQALAAIIRAAPQCDAIHFKSTPADGYFWDYLRNSRSLRDRFFRYVPDGVRSFHWLELPETFEQYLAKFKGKKRYNLNRQVRQLGEHVGGPLELHRVETVDQVATFVDVATNVARQSWQSTAISKEIYKNMTTCCRLEDLSRRGLLRSYLLVGAGVPCAVVLGYQFRDVYHYAEIAYDQSHARFSPGTVLLYLLIEDLYRHNRPRRVNFGMGDSGYKHQFSNNHSEDATVLLLKRSLANWMRRTAHASFRTAAHCAKLGLQNWKMAAKPGPGRPPAHEHAPPGFDNPARAVEP